MAIVTRTLKDGKTKRYDATLWVQIEGGRRKQIWKTFKKRRHAAAWLNKTDQSNRDGEYFEPPKILFSDFADEWIERYPTTAKSPLKPSTVSSYRSVIHRHLKPFFGERMLSHIRPVTIERDFRSQLKGISPATEKNILLCLGKMMSTAVRWGYLKNNPVNEFVTIPSKTGKRKSRALRPSEIKTLLEHCHDDAYMIVSTALLTGMRRGELFGLRWKDVDFKKGLIHVRQTVYWGYGRLRAEGERGYRFLPPKSERSIRSIDLSPELRRLLREHQLRSKTIENPHGLVFVSKKGTPWEPGNFVERRFQPAVAAAGIGKLRFHDLRHTFGSLKIEQGDNIYHVQRWLGHASIQTTIDTYGHLLRETNPESARRTDALIFDSSTG